MVCETFSFASYQDKVIVLKEDSEIIQSDQPISKMRKQKVSDHRIQKQKIRIRTQDQLLPNPLLSECP